MGRSALETVNALDAGPNVPAPSAYLLFSGKVVPAWAIRLFVLALIVPVLAATIDGMARARRRGHPILRWVTWVLASALPFVLALIPVLGAKVLGVFDARPPGPVSSDAVPPHSAGMVVLALSVCLIAIGFAFLRPAIIRAFHAGNRGLVPAPRSGNIRTAAGALRGHACDLVLEPVCGGAADPGAAPVAVGRGAGPAHAGAWRWRCCSAAWRPRWYWSTTRARWASIRSG
jgi:hypothetical protein